MSSEPPSFVTAPSSPPAPAPPPKRGWVKWVGLGCGCLVVVVAAFVALFYFGLRAATAGPEKVVQEFLAAAGAGDYATAYGHFSAPLQEVQPLDQFAAEAERNATFFKVQETTFNTRSVDSSGATLEGTVTLEAGTEVPASFKLVRENDAWKIISYHIGSP
jgi:hypothetical protein